MDPENKIVLKRKLEKKKSAKGFRKGFREHFRELVEAGKYVRNQVTIQDAWHELMLYGKMPANADFGEAFPVSAASCEALVMTVYIEYLPPQARLHAFMQYLGFHEECYEIPNVYLPPPEGDVET